MGTSATKTGISLKVALYDPTGNYVNWGHEVLANGFSWGVIRFNTMQSLLDGLQQQDFESVVVTCSMSLRAEEELDLMNKISRVKPSAIRVFIGSDYWNANHRAKAADLVHRAFATTDKPAEIAKEVEYVVKITRLLNRSTLQDYVANIGCLPTPPAMYKQLTDAINSEVSSLAAISEIVEQDPAIVAQIMKQVNSAYFGIGRTISSLKDAITLLGIRNIRSIALSYQLNSQFSAGEGWDRFSFERMNQRSLLVARLAQAISRRAGASKYIQDQAFLAGLLHDLGVLIMASHDPQQYRKLIAYSVKKQKPIYLVEKAAYGFFHGEVGAALLALWNLSPQVVEAVMLHHVPHLSVSKEFTALTAVHAADAMLPSIPVAGNCDISSSLSIRYLDQVGVIDEVPQWRVTANEYCERMVSNL
ncbi:MAG: HDOD domain-containing protein [Neptuniibacter sp.]